MESASRVNKDENFTNIYKLKLVLSSCEQKDMIIKNRGLEVAFP